MIRFSEKLQYHTSCDQTEILILSKHIRIHDIVHALKTMYPSIQAIGSKVQFYDENLNTVHYQDSAEPDGTFYVDVT